MQNISDKNEDMHLPELGAEFSLIKKIYKKFDQKNPHLIQGIGDDCALFEAQLESNMTWAISHDTLHEDRHFFSNMPPDLLGHKALAVNLSDLAAMGAQPQFFLLALSLPQLNPIWLEKFLQGLHKTAHIYRCTLIGGDTTQSKSNAGISIGITILGLVDANHALARHKAQAGDDIWVSHTIGLSRLALAHIWQEYTLEPQDFLICQNALQQPQPRIHLGQALLGKAHAAIDISDGLLGDLSHILRASNVGAKIDIAALLTHPILKALPEDWQKKSILYGGDDYELCFTAPIHQRVSIEKIFENLKLSGVRIGCITKEKHLDVYIEHKKISIEESSFEHFE